MGIIGREKTINTAMIAIIGSIDIVPDGARVHVIAGVGKLRVDGLRFESLNCRNMILFAKRLGTGSV